MWLEASRDRQPQPQPQLQPEREPLEMQFATWLVVAVAGELGTQGRYQRALAADIEF